MPRNTRTTRTSRSRRRPRTPWLSALALIPVLAVSLYGAGVFNGAGGATAREDLAPAAPGQTLPVTAPAGFESAGPARELLDTLPVKGRAPKTGYDRVQRFGVAWFDADRNGCDTRNDILARDLTEVTTRGGCRVLSGVLNDPYTGSTIAFERGEKTSSLVQIDHVVALLNSWETGAARLDDETRRLLANDPLNLLAVDGPTNTQKSASDAATWLPPRREFRCPYVARQVSVKAAYGLWVTPAEHAAMAAVLDTCPGQEAAQSRLRPPAPTP
ncbi:HNH endonuclease family protein [Mycetocola spongiae]|uniref:HNH endonuclease family protein n=1 Tax=Mycetocola spongiae TaxID=2859226 RepID=UPI001CF35A4E|nr:HNH endonuclease family protein [Mycetocola spongiae]UCR90148.1 HNH endonuclease family protein [Mycetocola spongiae]